MKPYQQFVSEILIDEQTLQQRIAELGAQITADYHGEEVLLVCILRGGVLFLTDLMRKIDLPLTLDFMAVSSYGIGARQSSGQARITLDLNTDIRDRHVLLVEDIVDSGYTLQAVLQMLASRAPRSLRTCVLLDKTERREVDVAVDYVGFTIPDKFVFGYGLDIDEYYRNLPFIAAVDPQKFSPEG
ncbi:MAG: hypoxanthine phosphoribosyltransferase [Anaerolineales bacterium]